MDASIKDVFKDETWPALIPVGLDSIRLKSEKSVLGLWVTVEEGETCWHNGPSHWMHSPGTVSIMLLLSLI